MHRVARRCERVGRPCQEPSRLKLQHRKRAPFLARCLAPCSPPMLVSRLSPLVSRHDVGPLRVGKPSATTPSTCHLPLTYVLTYILTEPAADCSGSMGSCGVAWLPSSGDDHTHPYCRRRLFENRIRRSRRPSRGTHGILLPSPTMKL